MIAPWPVRYRNWLKRHKPHEIVGDVDDGLKNPISYFLADKLGRTVELDGRGRIIIGSVHGGIPENVRCYLNRLLKFAADKTGTIQARTALRLLEEE